MHIHIGHMFFGAGNIGDDLMLGGFIRGIGPERSRLRLTCATAFDIASQRHRFPEIEWHAYDPSSRTALINACDVWVGLGGAVLQASDDSWLLADHVIQLELCRRAGKPVFFLGCGIDLRPDAGRPEIRLLLDSARWIWTRDRVSDQALRRMNFTRTSHAANLSHLVMAELPRSQPETGHAGFVCILPLADEHKISLIDELLRGTAAYGHRLRWLVQEVRALPGSEEFILTQLPSITALDQRRPDYGRDTLEQLVTGWGRPEVLFSTRFHGVIIGAWSGSRVVAYAREQKVQGIAEDLGIESFSELPEPATLAEAFGRARPVAADVLANASKRAHNACVEFLAAICGNGVANALSEGGDNIMPNVSFPPVERFSPEGSVPSTIDQIPRGLKRGEIFVVRQCLQAAGVFDALQGMVLDSIEEVAGPEARSRAIALGLRRLHEIVSVEALMAMNPVMAQRARRLAGRLVEAVAQSLLGLGPDVHFEDGPNVRIFCPHDFIVEHQDAFDAFRRRVGGGRLTLHGPHQDDRHFHPVGAINIWCAIDRVEVANGMTVYPEFYGHFMPFIPEDGNIRQDQYLGRPVTMALDPGDAWIFETQHVHGSTINQTNDTRFVISFRLTHDVPRFREKKWYNYVRPSDCTEAGPLPCAIDYRELPGRGPVTLDTSARLPPPVVAVNRPDGAIEIPSGMVPEGEIRPVNANLCVARVMGGPVTFFRGCPHEGADLAGGAVSGGQIVCPGHGLRMNTVDGCSGCRSLGPLDLVPCVEVDGTIIIAPIPELTDALV
jgi:polysaccharide pyruvyl transferase WcaK-like protein/nitrite reductase/ring-hydroxylating ferredoxin subunit